MSLVHFDADQRLCEPSSIGMCRAGDHRRASWRPGFSNRIAIELDGAAYHSGTRAERRDRRRDHKLGALRWRVIHFGWDEVMSTPEYVLETIDAYLDQHP